MNYKYIYLTVLMFLSLAASAHADDFFLNDPARSLPKKNAVELLRPNQYIQLGDYSMQITSLKEASITAAEGKGQVYIPMLGSTLPVIFSNISVGPNGEMLSGEVRVLTVDIPRPTYETPEMEVVEYLRLAKNNNRLPHLFSPALEAQGMDFGGHDLVITELVFTEEEALMNAVFLVENLDGRVTTFSKDGIHLNGDKIDFCNLEFPMEGPDQVSTDPVLPIIIKGYNKDAPVPLEGDSEEDRQAKLKNLGTYVTFSCDGFEQFQLVGEHHFKPEYLTPVETSPLPDKVIATFALTIETWGQFLAEVTFNSPFEVKGLDDVIFSISGAVIDYSDTQNPTGFPSAYFNIDENTGEDTEEFEEGVGSGNEDWRGFFIGEISVKLPESLKIGKSEDGGRIKLTAKNLIYESAVGMTANFITFVENPVEKTPIVEGSLEGWKMGVDTVQIKVFHNSFKRFKVAGEIHIPVTGEGNEIEYEALFEKEAGELQAQFNLKVGGEYDLPFLEGSKLIIEPTSVVGISRTGGRFKPYANLSGRINVTVNDLNFDGLGFQDLNIPAEEGISGISIYAFEFAGNTFVTGEGTAGTGEGEEAEPEEPAVEGEQSEKLKGFPISISDISFGSDETDSNLKRLGFTLKVNFTNPKIGVNAEGSFVVIGEVKPGELVPADGVPYAPWKAFVYKGFELNKLLIDMDMGGIKLVGGVRGFTTPESSSADYAYGTGFKGALELTVVPNITVQAVALFGKTPEGEGSHRYWFADAKLLLKSGIPIIPGVIGLNGFGGGAYYNMELITDLPEFSPSGADENPGENAAWALLDDIPATLSSLRYRPYKPRTGDVIGVKATIVLGTHPNAATANLDLTLDVSFNTNPFGLHTVSLSGDAYFMAPIDERNLAKVTASATITYNHTLKLLDASFQTEINMAPLLSGGGQAAMHVNLNEGQGNDWYIAIGSPPISKRMSLSFEVAGITAGSFNCYFVAGNLNALPADQRRFPLLREYHEDLAQFQDEVEEMDLSRAMGGFAILMGAQYSLGPISESWWIFRANAHATAGFDLMLAQLECAGYNEIGIKGWYLQGQAYAALSGGVDIKVDLFFHSGWYNIFSISAAALLQVKLPNPSWMKANIAGRYRILGGLIKGNFEAEFEVGEKCEPIQTPLDAASLVANIKVITDIKPRAYVNSEDNRVEIYREKLVVASLSMPIGGVLDFSEDSSDGLKIRPVMSIRSINNNVEGTWRFLDEDGNNVGVNGPYVIMEFNSAKLLEANTLHRITLEAKWEKKTNASPNWVPVIKDDGTQAKDREERSFMTGPRPDFLPNEAIMAQYPEYRDYKHHLLDNPEGGGIAMKLRGWGYLFNPMKKVEGGNDVREYDFFFRVTDLSSNEIAFEEPFTARPEPKWGEVYCDEYEIQYSRCQVPSNCSFPSFFGVSLCDFVEAIYGLGALLNIECAENVCVGNQVRQTSRSASRSNVKSTPNRWSFGGSSYNDLSVPTNSTNYDKAIGFPDFSAALLPERTYHIELVAVPIPDENYDVREEENIAETVSMGSNESYTVTTVARTINQDDDDGNAEEKLIYDYHFRTSKYPQLVDKLKETNWTTNGEWNDAWLSKDDRGVFYAREDFLDYNNIGSYNNYSNGTYLPLGLRSYTNFQHWLQNSLEKFDVAEVQRLAKNMELNNSWGYMALPPLPTPIRLKDYSFAKAKSIRWPSANSKFTMLFTSSYFTDKLDQVNKPFVPSYSTSNNSWTMTSFYPMVIERYQLMEKWSIYDKHIAEGNYTLAGFYVGYYIVPTITSRINPPPSNLFRLKYSAGPGSTTGSYNVDIKRGQASTGYVDYSGEYYIRNVGSERYLHEVGGGSSGVVSTTWQSNDQYNRFKLIRRSDGSYRIENKATGRIFGSTGWPDVRSSNNGYFINLIPHEDGSFNLKLSNANIVLVENYINKNLQYESINGAYYDYDKFTLESVWETPPVDLNKEYFIRVKTSGRYLRASNNIVSTSSTNDGSQIKFKLRRRAGGYYDITNKATSRRLHYVDDENEGYSTAYCSNCEESTYQFLLEEDNNNTSWTTDDDTYRIKNKHSGKYLQEYFDIESGPRHRMIASVAEANNGYAKFFLDASFQTTTDYSGEYLIQAQGSGRYLHDDGEVVSTLVQEDGNSSRFVLKKVENERYEIWNRASLRRMHYQYNGPNDSRYTTSNAQVQERDYQYILYPKSDGSFTIRWGSESLNLYEDLDLNYGPRHRRLHRTNYWSVPDESYSRFRLINPAGFNAEHEDLSGEYLIRVKGSGRYLNAGNNIATADDLATNDSPTLFVLRRRMNLQEFQSGAAQPFFYEIWSKEAGTRLRQVSGSNYKAESGALLDDYLYRLSKMDDGSLQIMHKNTGQKLFEHFEPGTINDKMLRSGRSTGNHYANFLLDEPIDVSLNYDDLSGAYSIMGKNSQRYWSDNNPSNSPVFSSQPTLSGERNRFALQKQSNNNYILKDPWGEVVDFSQGNFSRTIGSWPFRTNAYYRFSGLKVINNEDGSVKFMLHYRADLQWPRQDDNHIKFITETSSTVQLGTTPNDFFLMPEPPATDGAALDFDGVNDYVELVNESAFDFTSALTIEAWIKVDAFDKTWQAIVTKGDNAWRLHRYGNTNKIAFSTNGLSNVTLSSNADFNDSQWHHIAAVYDGNYKYLYVDGVLDAEVPAIGAISSNDFKVQIGENAQQRNRYFNGRIDEVCIWNIARSQSQIQNNMVQNLTGSENGLTAYYDFDNGTPCGDNRNKRALQDQSNSNNNAILINFGLRSDECPSNWVQNYELTPPPDLSNAYYLQVRGSGHYLDIRDDGVAVASNTSTKKFLLKKQGDDVYEIIYNGSRLHAEETGGKWTYTTTAATGLTENYYQFKLIPSTNNSYKIKCVASQNYIFEHFDLNQGAPEHQQLLSASNEPGDYGCFELKSTATASPENLSGEYLFRVTDSGRYMHCSGLESGGLLSTNSQANDDHIHFVLKRQAEGGYEIWNKANEQRLHASRPGLNWMFTTKEEDGLTKEHYQFLLAESSGFYTIKSMKTNEYLYENNTRNITSLATPTTNHLIELASTYLLPNDMSGEYFLRSQGSGRHLYNAGQRMETSAEISNNGVRFLLKKQADGSYKIQSKASQGYLHLASGGVYGASGNGEGDAYKFNLIFDASRNGYRLQCKANNEYLYEYFDLTLGGQHQQILSAPSPDEDYSYFFLESEYEAPPENLSGIRYIVANSTGRHLFRNNNNKIATALPTADSESLRFVLKRRANGEYEVWNKATAASAYQSVHVKTTMRLVRRRMWWGGWMLFPSPVDHFTALSNASSNESRFLFDFISQGDGVYRIINLSKGPLKRGSSNIITTGEAEIYRLETSFEVDGFQSRK